MVRVAKRAVLIGLAVVTACGDPNYVVVHPPVVSVRVAPSVDTIPLGGSVSLQVAALDITGAPTVPKHPPVWTSLDPGVLRVDSVGNVFTVWYGAGTIRAVVDGVEADARITVLPPPIVSVGVSPPRATPERGDTVHFTAAAKDSAGLPASTTGIRWSSSDTTLVRIDSTGRAVAVGIGAAQVTATVKGVSGSSAVTVLVPTASVTVTPSVLSLGYDDTVAISVVARDSAGTPLSGRTVHLSSQSPALTITVTDSAPLFTASVHATGTGASALVVGVGHVADTLRTTIAGLALRSASPGGWFTCAVAVDSTAYCWGWNAHGELGTGDTISGPRPRRVVGGLRFAGVTAGQDFACGLTGGGAAWCWGDNTDGTLGAAGPSSLVPVPVAGGYTFTTLSASVAGAFDPSYGYMCGLTSGGGVACWGTGWGATPVAVGAGPGAFDQVAVGGGGQCATLAANDSIYCWTPSAPTPAPLPGGAPISLQNNGDWSVTCGLSAGTAYCWGGWPVEGDEWQGRSFSTVFPGTIFAQTSFGVSHFCGLTSAGVVECWGDNSLGQLGSGGSRVFTDTLARVATTMTFTSISSGEFHSCAFGTDGRLYCWGENDFGEAGSSAYPFNIPAPQAVLNQR